MFIEFSVGNYRSFKERVTFSMEAADIASQPAELDERNIFAPRDGLRLLTSAVVYGANASGKSNFIGALDFMRDFVLTSVQEREPGKAIDIEPFLLSTTTKDAPSFFEVVFLLSEIQYRYGFEVTRERITKEWLYRLGSTREQTLFSRVGDTFKVNTKQFREGRGLQERTRSNALFLSVVAQFNGEVAQGIRRWFGLLTIIRGLDPTREDAQFRTNLEKHPYRKAIDVLIQSLDVNIHAFGFEKRPLTLPSAEWERFVRDLMQPPLQDNRPLETTHILTAHHIYDESQQESGQVWFDLEKQESDGTRRLFTLASPIIRALVEGLVLVIDEFDARLHPNLALELIRMFHHPEGNERHAQLIFTTHNTNLLSAKLFRRDQVWFVEKSRQGASDLYSLVEYRVDGKIIRNDASFEKDYVAGRYGAVPFIGDLGALLGAEHGQEARP